MLLLLAFLAEFGNSSDLNVKAFYHRRFPPCFSTLLSKAPASESYMGTPPTIPCFFLRLGDLEPLRFFFFLEIDYSSIKEECLSWLDYSTVYQSGFV